MWRSENYVLAIAANAAEKSEIADNAGAASAKVAANAVAANEEIAANAIGADLMVIKFIIGIKIPKRKNELTCNI